MFYKTLTSSNIQQYQESSLVEKIAGKGWIVSPSENSSFKWYPTPTIS